MTQAPTDGDFQSRMQHLDGLVQEIDGIQDEATRSKMAQIIQELMEFHGAALSNVLAMIDKAGDAGQSIMVDIAADELASNLLLLYGLHPQALETRVREALDKVRPYLASHGGNVELLKISDAGVVHLAMQGSCHGCPSSAITLKSSIEKAIYEMAPDVAAIEVQENKAESKPVPQVFVPIQNLLTNGAKVSLA